MYPFTKAAPSKLVVQHQVTPAWEELPFGLKSFLHTRAHALTFVLSGPAHPAIKQHISKTPQGKGSFDS